MLIATRKAVVVVPATVAVVAFLYALSTNKITFAVNAVYLWKGRFFLALPSLFVFLAYLAGESGIIRLSAGRSLIVVASPLVLVVATFVVRQATFDHSIGAPVHAHYDEPRAERAAQINPRSKDPGQTSTSPTSSLERRSLRRDGDRCPKTESG